MIDTLVSGKLIKDPQLKTGPSGNDMNNYTAHEIANIFPMMSDGEFVSLKADILANGLLEPIWTYEGLILDGRNRHQACQEVGVDIITREYVGSDPLGFVVSLNLKRRHLSESQRGMVAAKLANLELGDNQHSASANLQTHSRAEAAALLNVSERTVNTAKKVEQNAIPELIQKVESGLVSVSAAATIATLGDSEQHVIIAEIEAGEKPSEVIKKHVHVAQNSGENEWYTPDKFIEAARCAMGSIGLDPASSELANKTVKAELFFTREINGLAQSWANQNIWMNPPYAQPLMNQFADKLVAELANIKQAIVLVNNVTETKWFQMMADAADCICFPAARIKFIDKGGNPGAQLQGQCFFYMGDNREAFKNEFTKFGLVVVKA